MLDASDVILVVVDMQDRLLGSMPDRDRLVAEVVRLARGCVEMGVPVLLTEQIPDKLGATDVAVAAACNGVTPITKKSFSCMGEQEFRKALAANNRRFVLLCGIETHVCVAQTARELMAEGYRVEVVTDAVASRTEANRVTALSRLDSEGARRTSVEMALFEILREAGGDRFRAILKLVK